MNRDEINEAFGVTDDQLDRMAEPYESDNWRAVSGASFAAIRNQEPAQVGPQQTRIIRVHRLSDAFRNRTAEYHTTEEL